MTEEDAQNVPEETPLEDLQVPEAQDVVGGLNPQPEPPNRLWKEVVRPNPVGPVITPRLPR